MDSKSLQVIGPQAGIVYVDIISNLERVGDHTVNIAEAILDEGNKEMKQEMTFSM